MNAAADGFREEPTATSHESEVLALGATHPVDVEELDLLVVFSGEGAKLTVEWSSNADVPDEVRVDAVVEWCRDVLGVDPWLFADAVEVVSGG